MNAESRLYQLLRKSEKYLKTDMIYLAHGGFWLTIGQVITVVSGLLLAAAYANLLNPVTYGLYKYVLALASIIGAFSLTGMGTAITQAVSRGFDGALKKGFISSLRWGIGMTIISFTFALYYYLNDNLLLALSLVIVGIFQPLLNSGNLFSAYLNGKKDFKRTAQYHFFRTLLSTTVMISVLFITKDPVHILLAFFATHTALALFFYFRTVKTYIPDNQTDPSTVTYSKHLSIMNILGVLAAEIDKILVFHFLGAAELAIYTFAIAIPEQIKGTFKNLANLALPKFSEKKSLSEVRKTLPTKSLRFGIALLLVTIAYIIVAPIIFTYIFPQYVVSIGYSQVFALSFVGAISILPISAMQAQKEHGLLYKLNIGTSLIQILLLFVGAYFDGLRGVVIARVVTRYINAFVAYGLAWSKA